MTQELEELLEKATYLAALGTPIKSSRDFERAIKRALEDLQTAILKVKNPETIQVKPYMTDEERQEANALALKFGIRPLWLLEYLKGEKDGNQS